jgi:hypothetical protein
MTNSGKKFLTYFAVTLMVSLSFFAIGKPALAATNLGGMNLNIYCSSIDAGDAAPLGDAYSWHCVKGNLRTPINMTSACRVIYPGGLVIDRLTGYPSGEWECWSTTGKLGGLNLDDYCRAAGQERANLRYPNAYGWRCVVGVDNYTTINMRNACQWRYGSAAIDRMVSYFEAGSWECWG